MSRRARTSFLAWCAPAEFLVIGGAGSIGQAVCREIFKRNPRALHVVDISENNMVELVRDIRSTLGYIDGDFRTFALDAGSREFAALMAAGEGYDYVLNLSAMKHVRSEKDPFTLMRLIEVNVLNTLATAAQARERGAQVLLCFHRQGGQSGQHDGRQQADHGDVPDARGRALADFHGAVRQRRVLRRLAAARLQSALCQEAADFGAERRAPLFRHAAGIGRAVPDVLPAGRKPRNLLSPSCPRRCT